MFKRYYYLASVSVLASMAMMQAVQAMDPSAEDPTVKITRKKSDEKPKDGQVRIDDSIDWGRNSTSDVITNSLYYDSKGAFGRADPRIGAFTHISKNAHIHFWDNITGKIHTFQRIKNQVQSGNYDELTSEAIEFLIASFAGETQKNLFGTSNKELDPKILVKASRNLVEKFLKHLSKNNNLYGELPDGTRVTIYNRSLFKMFAEKCFPQIPVLTGVAITILDNETLKGFIQNKLIETVISNLQRSLKKQGITLKEKLGQETGKFIHSMIYDESSVDFKKLWEYLSPHLNHHLRNFMIPLLKEAKGTIIQKVETDLYYATVPTAGLMASSVAYFVAGPVLYSLGSFFNEPITGMTGWFLSSMAGAALTGLTSSGVTNSYFYETKAYASQYIDDKLDLWAHDLIPYSRKEHVLYGLNNNPSDIEKGLAFEDYQLRTVLDSKSFIGDMLQSIAEASRIPAILASIFGKNDPINLFEIKYCMCEEQEQAYRQLTLLRAQNPEEAEKVTHNLRIYPSFEQKIKFLNHLKAPSLNEIQREEDQVQKYAQSRKDVVKKIRGVAALLDKELCAQYEQFSSLSNPFYETIVEEILASSIESQDSLLEWIKNHREELQKFVRSFAAQTKEENFFEESPLQNIDETGNAEPPQEFVNKGTIKNFVTDLIKTCIQEYIDSVQKAHVEKHKGTFEYLQSIPLTERMDLAQIVHLHKRLMSPRNQSIIDVLGPEVTSNILRLLANEDLIKLSIISPDLHKLCLDIVDERKHEKTFNLKELSPEEGKYFAKYGHDLIVLEATYRELKLNHSAYTLFEILKDHLQQTKVLEKAKHDFKIQLSLEDESPLTLQNVTTQLLRLLAVDPNFNNVNKMIKPLKDSDPTLSNLYTLQRYKLVEEAAQSILEELGPNQKVKKTRLEPFPMEQSAPPSGGLLSSLWGSHKNVPLTEKMVNENFQQAQKTLECHDISSRGRQGFNLFEMIRAMKFNDPSQLSIKDFIEIHKRILATKLTKANDSDRSYINKYGEEVHSYKSMSPLFRDKLFYGYAELIETIRAHNYQFLKALFSAKTKI